MKRTFIEIDNGVVVDVQVDDVDETDIKKPKKLKPKKAGNTIHPSTAANKGDVIRNGKLYRKLERR